jgi:hypothetical protein
VHTASEDAADAAATAVRAAVEVGEEVPPARPVIVGRVTG